MLCSCGNLRAAAHDARTEPGQPREVREAERCAICGRIHWLTDWRPEPIEKP